MRRPLILLASAALLAVASTAAAQTCLVEGRITMNGNPLPAGDTVTCHHSGGMTVVETGAGGTYGCAIEAGAVYLEFRGKVSPACPATCEGACETLVCNAELSGGPGCRTTTGAEAALLLPPALVVPAVRRCRRRSDPASR